MIKTYSIHKDILIAWFAVELPAMFVKSSRVQTLAALLALDALFVEWCSVNCHERLKKKYIIFFVISIILSLPQPDTQILSMRGTWELQGVLSSPWCVVLMMIPATRVKLRIAESKLRIRVYLQRPRGRKLAWGAGSMFYEH